MPEAPDYTDVRPNYAENEPLQASTDDAAAALQKAIHEGRMSVYNEWDEDLRIFTAPTEPTSKFLVHAGKIITGVNSFIDPNSPTGKKDISRDSDNDGDVWAQFAGGICATRDPRVIQWCLAHSGDKDLHDEYHAKTDAEKRLRVGTSARECGVSWGLCRDVDWEATPSWAEMKQLQFPTSRRNAQLPVSLDLDKMFDRLMPNLGRTEQSEVLENTVEAARQADRERR